MPYGFGFALGFKFKAFDAQSRYLQIKPIDAECCIKGAYNPPDPHQWDSYQGQFDSLTCSMDHKWTNVPLTQRPKAGPHQDNRPKEKRTEPGTLAMAVLKILEMADDPKSNGFWIPATKVANIRALLNQEGEIMAKVDHAFKGHDCQTRHL
ncbi:hypothetical protein BY996DRAFT_6478367 [Phakopsora pachyrhizi]|nr:hypothetical protein BY996DRAFT_6478367 [Phakopsora pachyrhizi]